MRVEVGPNVLIGLANLSDAAGSPVGCLQRNDEAITGTECGNADQRQPGRTIEYDIGIPVENRPQSISKCELQVGNLPHSLVGQVKTGQRRIGRNDVDLRKLRRSDERLQIRFCRWIEYHFHARLKIRPKNKGTGQVRLRIKVDYQQSLSALLTNASEKP